MIHFLHVYQDVERQFATASAHKLKHAVCAHDSIWEPKSYGEDFRVYCVIMNWATQSHKGTKNVCKFRDGFLIENLAV